MNRSRIKNTLFLLFAAVMLAPDFSSCSRYDEDLREHNKNHMSNRDDVTYTVDEDVRGIFPYGEIYVTKGGNELGFYDRSFTTYTKLCDSLGENTENLCVTDDGIFCAGDNAVYNIDFDGNIKKIYNFPQLDGECDYKSFICVNDKYITAASPRRIVNEKGEEDVILSFMSADLSKGKNAELEKILDFTDDFFLNSFVPGSDDDEIYFMTAAYIYRLNPKTGEYEKVNEEPFNRGTATVERMDYLPGADCFDVLYESVDSSHGTRRFAKYSIEDGSINVSRSIPYYQIYRDTEKAVRRKSGREVKAIDSPASMIFTGFDYYIFDRTNAVVSVYSHRVNEDYEPLTVLGQSFVYDDEPGADGHSKDVYIDCGDVNTKFENDERICVNYKEYAPDQFTEKLRLDMMSGSAEYDVVLLGNAPEFLASILKYNLCLPLEGYEEINDGFKKYYDGVRDVMTYGGHLFGIPYKLTSAALTSDREPAIAPDYTFDEFTSMYENNRCVEDNGGILFRHVMKSVIEDGAEKGEISRDAIVECLEFFSKFYRGGISTADGAVYNIDGGIGGILETNSSINSSDSYSPPKYLRHMPSYNDKNYINIDAMVFVNAVTEIPDTAVKYLAYLVSDDFIAISNNLYEKSYLVKEECMDLYGSYHQSPAIDVPKEDPLSYGYEWKKYPLIYGMSTYDTFLIKNGNDMFTNASPRLYTYDFDSFLKEIYDEFTNSNPEKSQVLTVDEIADKIVKEAKYRLME